MSYLFLKDHFQWQNEPFDIHKEISRQLHEKFQKAGWEASELKEMKHVVTFKEKESQEIVYAGLSPKAVDPQAYTNQFEFYLEQLPTLNLSDVCLMMDFILAPEWNIIPNLFQFPKDFPSPIARELLHATYGRVLYHYQFFSLMKAAEPGFAFEHIAQYRIAWSDQNPKAVEEMKKMKLPDGVNFYDILTWHFHVEGIKFPDVDKGFIFPAYEEALRFKKLAERYK